MKEITVRLLDDESFERLISEHGMCISDDGVFACRLKEAEEGVYLLQHGLNITGEALPTTGDMLPAFDSLGN